jgi:KDO2-lipid IV(A) lauroyltransferase
LKSALFIFFLRGLSILSLGAARRVGSLLGRIAWLMSSRMAASTRTNLAICYPIMPESERLLLGKDSLSNTFQTLTECGPVWLWPAEKVLDHVLGIEGLALLQAAQAEKKGTVVIAPHLGNWEVFGLYLNQCGCGQSSQLYQAPREPGLDRLLFRARGRTGARMVATDNKGVIRLLKALKSGEIVGILPDQVPNVASSGDFAPFFGKQVLTMTLVSRLIQKTGARAVLGFAARVSQEGRQGWKIIFQEMPAQIYAEHISDSLPALNRAIEQAIGDYPEQYQWEYKRFRRVPSGEQRPY